MGARQQTRADAKILEKQTVLNWGTLAYKGHSSSSSISRTLKSWNKLLIKNKPQAMNVCMLGI